MVMMVVAVVLLLLLLLLLYSGGGTRNSVCVCSNDVDGVCIESSVNQYYYTESPKQIIKSY